MLSSATSSASSTTSTSADPLRIIVALDGSVLFDRRLQSSSQSMIADNFRIDDGWYILSGLYMGSDTFAGASAVIWDPQIIEIDRPISWPEQMGDKVTVSVDRAKKLGYEISEELIEAMYMTRRLRICKPSIDYPENNTDRMELDESKITTVYDKSIYFGPEIIKQRDLIQGIEIDGLILRLRTIARNRGEIELSGIAIPKTIFQSN